MRSIPAFVTRLAALTLFCAASGLAHAQAVFLCRDALGADWVVDHDMPGLRCQGITTPPPLSSSSGPDVQPQGLGAAAMSATVMVSSTADLRDAVVTVLPSVVEVAAANQQRRNDYAAMLQKAALQANGGAIGVSRN